MADALDPTNDTLLAAIKAGEKKVKALAKAGPGAGMATAVHSVHLRALKAKAAARGLSPQAGTSAPKAAKKITEEFVVQALPASMIPSEVQETFSRYGTSTKSSAPGTGIIYTAAGSVPGNTAPKRALKADR